MPTVTHPLLSMAATAQAVAHTQHHHGPVAQTVLFLMVMGFPQHLQVLILKASTICISLPSLLQCLRWTACTFVCKYMIVYMDGMGGLQCL
ncbi:hypothetical protein ZWY2020_023717 [Hordeum vulgare]|nr:hypothetical protein ZWY2020_023717 [Hordeum vulgare]